MELKEEDTEEEEVEEDEELKQEDVTRIEYSLHLHIYGAADSGRGIVEYLPITDEVNKRGLPNTCEDEEDEGRGEELIQCSSVIMQAS